jgi:hyperosmotically inducible protein
MKTNGTSKMIHAMLALAIASCTTFANAQTNATAPADASAQQESGAASAPASRPDSTLVRDVRRTFTRTPGLNFASIHVEAHEGVVTLTGTVPRRSQIELAGNAAKSVRGVMDVSNKLEVHTIHGRSE